MIHCDDSTIARPLTSRLLPPRGTSVRDRRSRHRSLSTRSFAARLAGVLAVSSVLAGCAGVTPALTSTSPVRRAEEAAALRRRFVVERSPEAIRTLLRQHLERGMTLDEVRGVLGEPGERVFDDAELKRGSPLIHQSDVIYRWGPDRNGRAYYLAFRDGKLVHFPAE